MPRWIEHHARCDGRLPMPANYRPGETTQCGNHIVGPSEKDVEARITQLGWISNQTQLLCDSCIAHRRTTQKTPKDLRVEVDKKGST